MTETNSRRSEREMRQSAAAEDDRRHLEALLDAALEATFPASDPVAVATPHLPEEAAKRSSRRP
ncbi:MAG TPA: hypothetical protein VFE11_16995 [Dongiaceae bacterium]|nr:hypothetical protein [Dongiaceae bacterium]